MWIVLKYKKNLNLLKTNLISKIDANIKFYIPKIKFVKKKKKKTVSIIFYIIIYFVFSDKFKDKKFIKYSIFTRFRKLFIWFYERSITDR